MIDSGYVDIQLEVVKEGQAVDISFVDNVRSIPKARGHIIFRSGECTVHNPLLMDYSITLTRSASPHNYQSVLHSFWGLNKFQLRRREAKTRFCCFIHRNDVGYRNRFAQSLGQRKRVDCPGLCLNNMERIGGRREEKIDFMSHY